MSNVKKRKHKTKPALRNVDSSKAILHDFRKLLSQYYPALIDDIVQIVGDPRRNKSIEYSLSEVVLACVMMYLFRQGSRNQMNVKREYKEFRTNYKKLLNLRVPHMDTMDAVMKRIDEHDLASLLHHLIRVLLTKRVLHKFRLIDKYFTIAIDGSGVFRYEQEPYKGCPYKTSKNGKLSYYQSVVEAKLVCSNGFSISVGSEWIVNEDGRDKQDCEYNASMRLLDKLARSFPRLPLCILMDGLFAKQPIQQKIKKYDWEFIMVWKDKTCWALQDQIAGYRVDQKIKTQSYTTFISKNKREEYELEYLPQSLDQKGIDVYYLKGQKREVSVAKDVEDVKTTFVFMSSMPVDEQNVKQLFTAGRLRWKIENEGFNMQKNSGLALHHKMNTKNITAIKNYYLCLQIAHLLSQLFELAHNLAASSINTIKDLWLLFCELLRNMTDYQPEPLKPKYNLRY